MERGILSRAGIPFSVSLDLPQYLFTVSLVSWEGGDTFLGIFDVVSMISRYLLDCSLFVEWFLLTLSMDACQHDGLPARLHLVAGRHSDFG